MLARGCYELSTLGLSVSDVRFRMDRDYWAVINTALGPSRLPWFAYRRKTLGGPYATHTPSRAVFPLHPHCRSSTMLLREASRSTGRLGSAELALFARYAAARGHRPRSSPAACLGVPPRAIQTRKGDQTPLLQCTVRTRSGFVCAPLVHSQNQVWFLVCTSCAQAEPGLVLGVHCGDEVL